MSKIAEAILKVSFSVGHVEKGGTNEHFKFKFQAWDDVLPAVRNACVEHGLTVVPSIVDVSKHVTTYQDKYGEKQIPKVTVQMSFTLMTGDETLVFDYFGESLDTDDKAIQKAATSATKYFFLKTFMIPVEGEVDPDEEKGVMTPDPRTAKEPAKEREKSVPPHRQIMVGWNMSEEDQSAVINYCTGRGTKASQMVPEAKAAGATCKDDFYKYMDGELV